MTPSLNLYQIEAAKEIRDKKKVLIADEMGMGKCAEAITAKKLIEEEKGHNIQSLIVCPGSVVHHWEDEINLWCKNPRISTIETESYDSDVRKIGSSDFVIVPYSTLSTIGNKKSKIKKLQDANFGYGIPDEVHNAKNPESIRGMAVKNLFDSMEYLALLSGTPIPSTIIDLYMSLSLLDKKTFPINSDNSKATLTAFYNIFRKDPESVRRILNERMIRRTAKDYLHTKCPEAKSHSLEIKLEGEHKEVYMQVYNNDEIHPGNKLIQLRLASIDPNLVKPDLLDERLKNRIGKMESSVYNSLDNLVENIVDNKRKFLLFTDFREGVTDFDKLNERYKKYGVVIIDGKVLSSRNTKELSRREFLRRKFQNNPDCKGMITTTVMDEGVDLTAATDIIHLTLPYVPSIVDQRNRRSQRIGEIKKDFVNIHYIRPFLDEVTPTITEGIEKLLSEKRRIINYILEQPFAITKKDLDEIQNGKPQKSKFLSPLINSPVKTVFSHLSLLKGTGFSNILNHYKKYPEEAKIISKLYSSCWEGYYGGNTANLYTKVINLLEEKGSLEKKLDIGSGPFSLSRKMKEPVINLDINEQMFNAGRILEKKNKIVSGNIGVQGAFHELPFEDSSFDLTLCSLALHTSKIKTRCNGKEIRERELALRETNRVLRDKGYSIITLPYTLINKRDLPLFYEGVEKLGFEVLPFSGFYRGPKDSNFKVYLAGLKKVTEPCIENLDDKFLSWNMDYQLITPKKHFPKDKKHILPKLREIKREFVNEFYLIGGKSLEDSFEGMFKNN